MNCTSCAGRLPSGAAFCPRCGARTARDRSAAAEERKVVTILFCDVVESTELSAGLDPELLREVLLRYYRLMQERVEAHDGVVEKFIGDAVMAVFGLTATHEDDARLALACALDMRSALAELDAQLAARHRVGIRIRIGVHTGEVVTTADPNWRQALVSGEVVNVAARLQTAAGAGEILLSAATYGAAGAGVQAAQLGPLQLKGAAAPVAALRLTGLGSADPRESRRFDVPFVGRERDLGMLDLTWRRVVEEHDSHMLTLLGEAGIGKTRLTSHWLDHRAEVGDGVVATGRCRARGEGGSLGALAECVNAVLEQADADLEQLCRAEGGQGLRSAISLLRGGLLLDGTPAPSARETGAAIIHVLTAVALERPVLLLIDDCHSAQPMLLDLLGLLADGLARLPVLLLCLARPDLLEFAPSWGSGRSNGTTLTIGGLTDPESEQLADLLTEVAVHDVALSRRIVAQAGGNPLYLEQLAAVMQGEGSSADRLPPNLQALLAARFDRLDETERRVLRHASVLEPVFRAEDLRSSAGEDESATEYEVILGTLIRGGLLEPVCTRFGEPTAFRFVNSVTQRVAYEGLTKRRRGDVHQRYAWYIGGLGYPDATVGGHLAKAYRYFAEVGPLDEHLDPLRRQAAELLAGAGSAALRRIDIPWACTLLDDALALTEPGDGVRPRCLQELGEAQLTVGRRDEARETLRRALSEAVEQGSPATAAHARLNLACMDPAEHPGPEAEAERSLELFAEAGDELGLARSKLILAAGWQRRGRSGRAIEILEPAVALAHTAQADRELANTLGALGLALWQGPTPALAAIEQCEAFALAPGADRPAVRATLGFPLTMLHAVRRDAARTAESLARTHEAMATISYAEEDVFHPLLEAMAVATLGGGDGARVLASLREARDAARALNSAGLEWIVSVELARTHLAHRQWDLAAAAVDGPEPGANRPVDRATQFGIRARVSMQSGDVAAARQLAREALRAAARTDSPAVRALALLDLAHVAAGSRPRLGRAAACGAIRLFEAKGHVAGTAEATAILAGMGDDDV